MPSPNRFASTIRKLEDLPSDGGKAVDTLAGANLRIFIRLSELEAALARVTRRVAALEGSGATEEPRPPAGNGSVARFSPDCDRAEATVAAGSPAERAVAYTLGEAAGPSSRSRGQSKPAGSRHRACRTGRGRSTPTSCGGYIRDALPPQCRTSTGHQTTAPEPTRNREAYLSDFLGVFGGCSRTRTCDPLIKTAALEPELCGRGYTAPTSPERSTTIHNGTSVVGPVRSAVAPMRAATRRRCHALSLS